ncbi:hypothetical protein OUZ56_025433 [Daphnia magna]|uniref:Uncharacterized protein n=1 Tax=Daphnia magna TaxID=35525 RepID=A0ABQ9ZJU7_9CRUS|nr:hypothetical protein OUZ56_025433 [Daphnia magna]
MLAPLHIILIKFAASGDEPHEHDSDENHERECEDLECEDLEREQDVERQEDVEGVRVDVDEVGDFGCAIDSADSMECGEPTTEAILCKGTVNGND